MTTTETHGASSIATALAGRAAFYDAVAALYYKPLTQEQIDRIAQGGLAAFAGTNELVAEGLHDMERALSKRHSGTRQELAVDFTGAFAGTSSWKGRYATPYESVFTSEEGLLFQESYHEVHRLYRDNGVRKSEGYDFPDDHLSFICEFQAVLARRAIEALEAGDAASALGQVRCSQAVLRDHVLSWFDGFEELALHLVKTRFYRGVLKTSRGFFLFDAGVLDDMAEELERL
ncbi:molecular chaperone TorD family protein [Eggerthella guodeyinii]|uniref:Molecular chaperone TorD family protein n=1 Tax=Eggerthella guodeyinii TaxID=2690837 RepID=A0A6L7IQ35_9ACTN|nr:molecular chaperone TorD family protein [Eggerthella guodeyinii]QOS69902.1 molecular chaperone TorD family protein [Eggerthella guodeyinii]